MGQRENTNKSHRCEQPPQAQPTRFKVGHRGLEAQSHNRAGARGAGLPEVWQTLFLEAGAKRMTIWLN